MPCAIVEGTARSAGDEFFTNLVKHLATAIDVQYAFVAEFAGSNTRARTIAYWGNDRTLDNIEWDLPGSPCEDVVKGNLCHHPTGVSRQFPDDRGLVELGIESYLGVPLLDGARRTLGHLAVFDTRPMSDEPRRLFIFRIFAARAAVELERLRSEKLVAESERRFRHLYEEAPIAYLTTDVEGRLLSVNDRVTDVLGYSPEKLLGKTIQELTVDDPSGRSRSEQAILAVRAGRDVRGTEIELRRKDGQSIWVSTWIRPEFESNGSVVSTLSIWIDINDRVLAEKERARLEEQNLYLQEEIKAEHNFEEIVGASPSVVHVLNHIRSVAPTDASVLIYGETGTGKELIARAIHFNSKRREKPLIKVNCAALPTGLVESELFGHEKGAFTGAIAKRLGRFELADGGTIFLDEIGEIPLEVQAKLLRVLQEREFDRLGGKSPISVDVRVIAATNRDLRSAVRERTFREDLYYRLNVFPVEVPPLRERKDDIPLIAHFLVKKYAMKIGKPIDRVGPAALRRLVEYRWPGNVRELENVIERAVILARGSTLVIEPDILDPGPSATRFAEEQKSGSLEEVERAHIRKVLDETAWIIEGPKGAARVLVMHPNTLRSRMKKLGIVRTPRVPTTRPAPDGV